MHDQQIHRHHAIQIGDQVDLARHLNPSEQRRDIRMKALHLLREFRLGTPAAMDENPVITPGKQAHRLAGQRFGIGLALLRRERGETDPRPVFSPIGLGCSRRTAGFGSSNTNPSFRNTSQ